MQTTHSISVFIVKQQHFCFISGCFIQVNTLIQLRLPTLSGGGSSLTCYFFRNQLTSPTGVSEIVPYHKDSPLDICYFVVVSEFLAAFYRPLYSGR